MIDLSIVIVNYNVRYFIAQCIQSILQSNLSGLSIEIIVIDNNSQDGSFPYLDEKFGHDVIFLKNDTNQGFAKACNQGFRHATGKVILFLNPDTIVQKDTLYRAYFKLSNEPEIGALGVKLMDGSGNYLPESKRSLPNPINSFIKLAGIKIPLLNKFFSPYNLDHLDNDKSHNVDVLCGAFIMVKKEVLSITGGFDEAFFMYGEDIDLCKRIKDKGYELLYYPEAAIVHFKGESHKEKDLNYYRNFFNAMSVYASKHYGLLSSSLLRLGIFIAAVLSLLKTWVKTHLNQIVDLILIFSIFYLVKSIWATLYFNDPGYYPQIIHLFFSIYTLIIFIALLFSKYYSKKASLRNIIIGLGAGLMFLLVFHGIMPENFRFSRMIILLTGALLIPSLLIGRMCVNFLKTKKWVLFKDHNRKALIVGSTRGFNEVRDFLSETLPDFELLGRVFIDDPLTINEKEYIGHIDQMKDFIKILSPDEVIFNLDDVDIDLLFGNLNRYGRMTEFKGYSDKFNAIIGNANPTKSAEVYTTNFQFRIIDPASKLLKWSFDKIVSILILILFPIFLIIKRSIVVNSWRVFIGKYTWVSYHQNDEKINDLPPLKVGILSIGIKNQKHSHAHLANLHYARNYSLILDIEVFFRYLCQINN